MPDFPKRPISVVRNRLLTGMLDFMHDGCGYTQTDVDRCAAILDVYLTNISSESSLAEEEIQAVVRRAMLDLNALNEQCGGSLIETDQREDLCEILLVAAQNAGLPTNVDITEEWREW